MTDELVFYFMRKISYIICCIQSVNQCHQGYRPVQNRRCVPSRRRTPCLHQGESSILEAWETTTSNNAQFSDFSENARSLPRTLSPGGWGVLGPGQIFFQQRIHLHAERSRYNQHVKISKKTCRPGAPVRGDRTAFRVNGARPLLSSDPLRHDSAGLSWFSGPTANLAGRHQ